MTDKLYRMAHTSNNRQQSLLICLLAVCVGFVREPVILKKKLQWCYLTVKPKKTISVKDTGAWRQVQSMEGAHIPTVFSGAEMLDVGCNFFFKIITANEKVFKQWGIKSTTVQLTENVN